MKWGRYPILFYWSSYAPSAPDSFVQSICRLTSPAATDGRVEAIDCRKSPTLKGGSSSSSVPTSVQLLSSPSGSPGEHGVSFRTGAPVFGSSTMTGLKCVAPRTFLTGCMSASRTTTAMSDPEYLFDMSVTSEQQLGQLDGPFRFLCKLLKLCPSDFTWCRSDVEFEHPPPCLRTG